MMRRLYLPAMILLIAGCGRASFGDVVGTGEIPSPTLPGSAGAEPPLGAALDGENSAPVPLSPVVMNELHMWGDGVNRFLEIVNISPQDVLLDGLEIARTGSDSPDYTFDPGIVLPSGHAVVVFRSDPGQAFTNTIALAAGEGYLSTDGSENVLLRVDGETLEELEYPSDPRNDESWARDPDFSGEFQRHRSLQGERLSPGSFNDSGAPF